MKILWLEGWTENPLIGGQGLKILWLEVRNENLVIGGQDWKSCDWRAEFGGQDWKSCDWRAELKIMFAGGQDWKSCDRWAGLKILWLDGKIEKARNFTVVQDKRSSPLALNYPVVHVLELDHGARLQVPIHQRRVKPGELSWLGGGEFRFCLYSWKMKWTPTPLDLY